MRLAIASGKGGTGKTTLAVSLALALAGGGHQGLALVDCDVEQPNCQALARPADPQSQPVLIAAPQLDPGRCTDCGACAASCQYGAIVVLKGEPTVLPELCHGCGACWLVCRTGAVTQGRRRIGEFTTAGCGLQSGLDLWWGQLDPGQPAAPPIIRALRRQTAGRYRNLIMDGPPGAACPLVETLRGADACLLVTEPTPFGRHDLGAAAEVTALLGLPTAVVINRAGLGDPGPIEALCAGRGLPILARVPFSRTAARILGDGGTLLDCDPAWAERLAALWQAVTGVYRKNSRPRPAARRGETA